MEKKELTKKQARQFLLLKQGLIGAHKFKGQDGILEYIHQAGCIQFDPINVCGKNAELVLQSRIKKVKKSMLYSLLYDDRKLIDYFNKNLAVIPVEHWKYFEREREEHRRWERSHAEILKVHDRIIEEITVRGALCSADLDMPEKVDWYWSDTKLSRAALEYMYFSGELGIHHKKGSLKYYDLLENCIPADILAEPEPYPVDFDHRKWRVRERIGSVGMLWNKASDAWLGISGLKAAERNEIFAQLLSEREIIEVQVESVKEPLYCLWEDVSILEYVKENPRLKKRCEFIAPLDNLMWDRNLIKAIFDFEYKWEIYTPKAERKYGYYVLPILYGDRFVGRIEAVYDKKAEKLGVLNLWFEPDVKRGQRMDALIQAAVKRLELYLQGS